MIHAWPHVRFFPQKKKETISEISLICLIPPAGCMKDLPVGGSTKELGRAADAKPRAAQPLVLKARWVGCALSIPEAPLSVI